MGPGEGIEKQRLIDLTATPPGLVATPETPLPPPVQPRVSSTNNKSSICVKIIEWY